MIDEPIKVLRDDNEELVLEYTDMEGGKRTLHINKIDYEDLLAFYVTGQFSGRKYLERKYGKDV
jgi:hypothetical protein